MKRPRPIVLFKIALALLVVYSLLVGGLFTAMLQPPDRFAPIMARIPWPMFAVLPFESLWSVARDGDLQAGDLAPDFSLQTLDKKSRIQLSSFRGKKPVVLVFGSYT